MVAVHSIPCDVLELHGGIARVAGGQAAGDATNKAQLDAGLADARNLASATGQLAVAQATAILAAAAADAQARTAALIGAAPQTLDTLEEIAARLSDDTDALASISTQLGQITGRLDDLEAGGSGGSGVRAVARTVGDGAASLLVVDHLLNSQDVSVVVREANQRVFPVDIATSLDQVTLDFGSYVPAAGSIRVLINVVEPPAGAAPGGGGSPL